MSQPDSLRELLQEWRRMGELEGEGIRGGDWDKVARSQRRKSCLREIISASIKNGAGDLNMEDFQTTVRELIAMEERNSQWISQRREALVAERSRARLACGNLRRVRSAYGGPRPAAIWNSYS
jgi:hypothetical protein